MNKKLLALMGCVLIAGTAIAAEDNGGYEFHGYGRSGAVWEGVNKVEGFPRSNSEIGKHLVGRLGIENDTYWDMGITKNFKMDDGAWAKVTAMIGQWSNTWETDLDGVQGKQIFGEIGGGSFLGEASVWAGKRYYNRRDIHVNDLFYTNYSGTGGGFDNIGLGGGKLSVGVIGRDFNDVDSSSTKNTTNLLLNYKIAGFDIDLAATKAQGTIPSKTPAGEEEQTDVGYQALLQYNLGSFYGAGAGFANTFVQYGMGLSSGGSLGEFHGSTAPSGITLATANSFRVGTYGLAALDDTWDLFTSVLYQMDGNKDGAKGDSNSALSVIVRPIYAINKNFELQFEGGYGMVINGLSDAQKKDATLKSTTTSAYKLSLAPTFKLDTTNFFARPEVRFFVTYTGYTNNADVKLYGDAKAKETAMTGMGNAEVTGGVQMEMWF